MTAQLREIPLTQVAHELGLDPDPKDKHKWRSEDYTINITGSKFYDFKHLKGGGGAIDLVMYLERCNFTEAVHWLQDRFGEPATLQTVTKQAEQTISQRERQPFVPPEVSKENWLPVRKYLTQTRGLPGKLIDQLHQEGILYADERQNTVFIRRSFAGEVMGASLRGTAGKNNSFKGLAPSTRRSQGWFYTVSGGRGQDPIQRVVLTESAIDALSYQTLHPPDKRTLYLSTDGAGFVPIEHLQRIPQVTIALDQDQAGEAMASRLLEDLPQASHQVPSRKDWNEDLKAQLQVFQKQMRERQQSRQEQNCKKGISL
jgi:hypothetical protein